MKISDELRETAGQLYQGSIRRRFIALASRIDAEMVELPKDKDGVPIHVGDTVYGCSSGRRFAIDELQLVDSAIYIKASGVTYYIKASNVTHARPDSLERIAGELDEMVDAARSADDGCEKLADLAERIRKLAKEEGQR